MKTIKFEDAVELSKIHVGSFQIPTNAELMQLEVGHVVKVCANNERFWTKIIDINFDTVIPTMCKIGRMIEIADLVMEKIRRLN